VSDESLLTSTEDLQEPPIAKIKSKIE